MRDLFFIAGLLVAFTGISQVNNLLIARNTGKYVLWNSDTIRVFGFTEKLSAEVEIPGPTLIYNEGDSVKIDLWNVSQGAPHTIHLHGLDVNQANDGVPHLSFDVAHMDHGFYHFKAPHAGTYLYHCHVVSTIHVQAGMYGFIIIRPTDGSFTTWNGGHSYDKEIAWMTSEVDTNWHKDDVLEHAHDTSLHIMRIEIPEYHPQHFLVNGLSEQQLGNSTVAIKAAVGEKVFLRLANIGYYGNRIQFPSGLNARILSSDGRPLPVEELSDSLIIYPGERYGVMLEASSEFMGSISINYFNLNTGLSKSIQTVDTKIEGYVSLPEENLNYLKIYPNPATDNVLVEFEDFKPTSWSVTNVFGQVFKIGFQELYPLKYSANISHIPNGFYIIRFTDIHSETRMVNLVKN